MNKFFEKIGFLCSHFSTMIILLLFPFLFWLLCILHTTFRWKTFKILSHELADLEQLQEKTALQRKRNSEYMQKFQCNDPSHVDSIFEQLSFCKEELQRIDSLCSHPLFFANIELHERLQFLKNQNKMQFVSSSLHHFPDTKEILIKQIRAIQVDEKDLLNLLNLIESPHMVNDPAIKIKSPLFITKFMLEKKSRLPSVFILNMELLQHAFSKKEDPQ